MMFHLPVVSPRVLSVLLGGLLALFLTVGPNSAASATSTSTDAIVLQLEAARADLVARLSVDGLTLKQVQSVKFQIAVITARLYLIKNKTHDDDDDDDPVSPS